MTASNLCQYGVRLVRGVVKEVHPNKLVLSDGSDVPYGLLVWSTGVGPSTFVRSLDLPKSPGGRYIIYVNQLFMLESVCIIYIYIPWVFSLFGNPWNEMPLFKGSVLMNGYEFHPWKMYLPLGTVLAFLNT